MNFAKPLSQAQTSENQKSEKSKMEVLNAKKDNLRLTKSESLKQIKRKSRLPKNESQDLQKSEVLNSEKDSSRPPKIIHIGKLKPAKVKSISYILLYLNKQIVGYCFHYRSTILIVLPTSANSFNNTFIV